MSILILTGPAASGKNTVSEILSHKKERCAVIDVDVVRCMYRQPHKAPWEGEEGNNQQKLGVKNAILLAKNFAHNGTDVIILDVLTDETAKIYKEELPEAKIVLLMPTYDEAFKRYKNRPHTIKEGEFRLVYDWQKNLTIYDRIIDNTALSAEETAAKLDL